MPRTKILVVSDVHYACAAEQARPGHELSVVRNRLGRFLLRLFRDYIWLHDPYNKNHLLEQCLRDAGPADLLICNGDSTLDTAFVGISDDAACQSARECLDKMRQAFGPHFRSTVGDHELGKFSIVGKKGGLRIESWRRVEKELGVHPFWQVEVGAYILLGLASTLVAFSLFEGESLESERAQWWREQEEHLAQIRQAFACLRPGQRVILFCHDPSALPFLWREEAVRGKLAQIELTIIGHLHSPFIFWKSRLLAGMPVIRFFGNTIRRYSGALREARYWKPFRVRLCPSLAGLELLKDGGYLTIEIDPEAKLPPVVTRKRLAR